MASPTFDEVEPQSIWCLWAFAGELAFDFRKLTVQQARRIAPFVVEAAWRRGQGPLLLIHGAQKPIARELRKQLRDGDWMAWSSCSTSKRHATSPTRILLGLRDCDRPVDEAYPDFEPGHEDFDAPRCVGQTAGGAWCKAPAARGRVYCAQHETKGRIG